MKIQIKWVWPQGPGYLIGDLFNITEVRNPLTDKWELSFFIKTLNSFATVGSAQVMKIWPYQGEYSQPNTHLMGGRLWQRVPRSKIRWAKKKRRR